MVQNSTTVGKVFSENSPTHIPSHVVSLPGGNFYYPYNFRHIQAKTHTQTHISRVPPFTQIIAQCLHSLVPCSFYLIYLEDHYIQYIHYILWIYRTYINKFPINQHLGGISFITAMNSLYIYHFANVQVYLSDNFPDLELLGKGSVHLWFQQTLLEIFIFPLPPNTAQQLRLVAVLRQTFLLTMAVCVLCVNSVQAEKTESLSARLLLVSISESWTRESA